MKFSIDRQEHYTILTIDEEKLDSSVAPEVKSEFVTLQAEGVIRVILSLENVKYSDSSGLSALLVGNRIFSENGDFILYGVNEHVMKLISISQLDKVINILPSKEEAIDAIFLNEIEKGLREEGKSE
ncbi:MAG: STAS domain-containing protein [Cyclobacteriaceae bacterium]